MKNKTVTILVASLLLLWLGFFTFLFVNCIISYNAYDLEYDELKYSELTFKSFIKVSPAKSNWYEIYFQEYEAPFRIDSISQKGVNKKALEQLSTGATVKVYYRDNAWKEYDYEICEMTSGSDLVLSLADYEKCNRNNQIIGMILSPIMGLGGVYCVWTYPRSTYPPKPKKKSKKKSNKASVRDQKAKKVYLPAKTEFGIIALAYMHRYGWLAVIGVFCLAFRYAALYIFALGLIAMAAWSFVGYKCRWRHIFCSFQNAAHRKMSPERIDWDSVGKSDAYGLPVLFGVLGFLCLCVAILS